VQNVGRTWTVNPPPQKNRHINTYVYIHIRIYEYIPYPFWLKHTGPAPLYRLYFFRALPSVHNMYTYTYIYAYIRHANKNTHSRKIIYYLCMTAKDMTEPSETVRNCNLFLKKYTDSLEEVIIDACLAKHDGTQRY